MKNPLVPGEPVSGLTEDASKPSQENCNEISSTDRRSFLGKVSGMATVAMAGAIGAITTFEPLLGSKEPRAEASVDHGEPHTVFKNGFVDRRRWRR
jgi:hypothetical protein